MTNLNASMRPKVNGDTYFIPDSNGGVYFRNNSGSFRVEGDSMDKWIEKLIPVFNGKHTLEEITDGLPDAYRIQVYDIAALLQRNGYVRDVSQDLPHELPETILDKYASQVEFLDHLGGSGAHRFQRYRQEKVLAVGCGPMLVSLAAALLNSGLPKLHLLVTDSMPTNRQRLQELEEHARASDPVVYIEEMSFPKPESESTAGYWRHVIKPFQTVLYVSQEGDIEELRPLHAACRQEKKVFLPTICLQQTGVTGPLVHPDFEECWESAWRRLHQSALCKDPQLHAFSVTAGALLANAAVFEWFKKVTGATSPEQKPAMFLLNLETLEGDWHSFLTHPLVSGYAEVEQIEDVGLRLEQSPEKLSEDSNRLFPFFSRLTSAETGILHLWDEGDLKQLPLSQCRVQAVDPLSEGPAALLPDSVCAGLTHEEARREAGLAGMEAYISRLAGRIAPQEFIGIGVGEILAEGVCRGLQKCLAEELGRRQWELRPLVSPVQLGSIEDEHCRFYLQSLTTLKGMPTIGLGEAVSGFPAVWVGSGGRWYGGVDLNLTLALRRTLQLALMETAGPSSLQAPETTFVLPEEQESLSLDIPEWKEAEAAHADALRSALQVLHRNGKRMSVLDLALEPFLAEEKVCALGVLLRKEESL